MHAALGEPVRLAIAEAVSVADASPKELAAAFELPSNLLAHHLSVLEIAGLVDRRRSEGDARRTYLHLRLDDPTVAGLVSVSAGPLTPPRRVVFVCTHNSARSQLATAEWHRISPIPTTSAGTHPATRVHRRATATARRHHLSLSGTTAHVDDVVGDGDLIVAVCDQAHEELATSSRTERAMHWSVPDPVRIDTNEAFETAFTDIQGRVHRLASSLVTRE